MKKTIVFFLLILSFSVFSQDSIETKEIEVAIGIDQTFKLPYKFNTRVEVGNPNLIEIVLVPPRQEVTFKGRRKGRTSVTFRNVLGERKTRYIISVTANELSKTVSDLRELLGDIEGLEIGIKGGRVYVGGQIVVPTDVGKIEAVIGENAETLKLYELHPQTQELIARKMQEEIAKNGMKNVTTRVVNSVFWIEGVIASEDQQKMVTKIVEGYIPIGVKGLHLGTARADVKGRPAYQLFLTINTKKQKQPAEKLIKISAQFVELARDYGKVFAFKWAPLMSEDSSQIRFGRTTDGEVTSNSSGTLSGVISNLFPKLRSAKDAGYARIIQSGMIITKNDKEGTLEKQTETSYAVGTGEFQKAEMAKVGFSMKVTPREVGDEKVEMNININVVIPSGQTSSGNPVNTTNNLKTDVVIKSKQSAVVGGVVQSSTITQYDKDDPAPTKTENGSPLFNFLRSKSYKTAKNQFVMFVTPEIIESASVGTEEVRKKFRRRTR
jgi:pilus assembly protein CpaC